MSDQQKPSIQQVRSKLTPAQIALLDQFWRNFLKKGEWPLTRVVYAPDRKDEVVQALSPLTGNIEREERNGAGKNVLYLSLVGILMTTKGRHYQKLLSRFLQFQHNLYRNKPEQDTVNAKDVAAALRLLPYES